jgi:hypothetical protein
MTESRLTLAGLPDDDLAAALRECAAFVAFPTTDRTDAVAGDLATTVRHRIELNPPRRSIWQRLGLAGGPERGRVGQRGRPLRRSLVLALVALLVIAAVAGAVGLGLPGLRIIFGQGPTQQSSPSATPNVPASATPAIEPSGSASLTPLGSSMALGTALPLADVERLAGFPVLLPTKPDLGPPDAAYLSGQRVALVWANGPDLPDTLEPGIGLLLSEFRGKVDEGFFEKILGQGTTLTRVTVGGSPGFWINGSPHYFLYVDPNGQFVEDDHRVVGDVLVWSDGDVTYRLETSLGLAAATAIAESMR